MSDYVGAAARLEEAVINMEDEELRALYKKIGFVEFSAKALGFACRFRGVETVKTLCECGASFDIPQNEEAEARYRVYSGMKYANYRSDFSLYLLNITKQIKGACCCKGLKLLKQIERADKKKLGLLSDEERAEVLGYLCGNREKLSFDPSELLYYAIFARDEFIVSELLRLGVNISQARADVIINGGLYTNPYWYEWCSMVDKLGDENYIPVLNEMSRVLGGVKFHCTNKIFEVTKKRFSDPKIAEFFFDSFEMDRLGKTDIIRGMIDNNAVSTLPFVEKAGWLANNKRRDEMIKYARDTNHVECTAWLLDFKNRTADLAAERERAEKRQMAELNAAPDSVMMLKKIWSYKKRDDGTLVITSYKGHDMVVTVPAKIGKSIVTAIGAGAFSANSGGCAGMVCSTGSYEVQNTRRQITKITLPDTIKVIGASAFAEIFALCEINIPDGVEEIGGHAFYNDRELARIDLPSSLKRIDMYAFAHCDKLREITIPEGAEIIGECAFYSCGKLEKITLPNSVREIKTSTLGGRVTEAFACCPKLTVCCGKGSYAEKYCKEKGFKYKI